MPPGNNNAKPKPKGKCTYCRKESCSGDNCTFTFEGVCGNDGGLQRRYVRDYPSLANSTVGVSTLNKSQVSGIDKEVTTVQVSQPGSTLQQSNVTAARTSTLTYSVSPSPAAINTFKPESKVALSNTANYETKASYPTFRSEPFPLSHASSVSKPEQKVVKDGSYLSTQNQGLINNEHGENKNFSETLQLTSSAQVVISKAVLLPNVKVDEVVPALPSNPVAKEELLEDKKKSTKSLVISTNCEGNIPKKELSKTDITKQNTDVNASDGVKPPISKPTSCASIISKSSSNSVVVNKTSVKHPKPHHSPNALKYEGIVCQILDSRNAKVRVAERNGIPVPKKEWGAAGAVHKFALLVVNKIMYNNRELFYPPNTCIDSVLSKGDILNLICTAHNKPSSGFQLFAHEAWCTGQKIQLNNDADSVASYRSQTGSETQESTSSKTNRGRRKKKKDNNKVPNGDSYNVSDVVNQWLDTNEYSQNRNETSKTLKIIAGCHFIGKVTEVRLPYAFIVEISSNDDRQFVSVFVFSSHFHPQGITSPALPHGVSVQSLVNIGDEIVIIPTKNTAVQENNFEWVASKAWPKHIQSITSCNLDFSKKSELITDPMKGLNQQEDTVVKKTDQQGGVQPLTYLKTLTPLAKNYKEFDGVIISLQYDWGLVKEAVGSQSAYVFTRENAHLYGLCLQHIILDDVFKEGQLVKFSMETEDIGAINVHAVWHGNKMPDFNSFDIATCKYCEESKIKFSTEDLLIQHGKLMYLGQ